MSMNDAEGKKLNIGFVRSIICLFIIELKFFVIYRKINLIQRQRILKLKWILGRFIEFFIIE